MQVLQTMVRWKSTLTALQHRRLFEFCPVEGLMRSWLINQNAILLIAQGFLTTGQLAGFAALKRHKYDVAEATAVVYVAPQYRRQGHARYLARVLLEHRNAVRFHKDTIDYPQPMVDFWKPILDSVGHRQHTGTDAVVMLDHQGDGP